MGRRGEEGRGSDRYEEGENRMKRIKQKRIT